MAKLRVLMLCFHYFTVKFNTVQLSITYPCWGYWAQIPKVRVKTQYKEKKVGAGCHGSFNPVLDLPGQSLHWCSVVGFNHVLISIISKEINTNNKSGYQHLLLCVHIVGLESLLIIFNARLKKTSGEVIFWISINLLKPYRCTQHHMFWTYAIRWALDM
jgi:hypothetical protein